MTEAEALQIAWSALREAELESEIVGLNSIRLSTAQEVRDVLGIDDPHLADTWYVSFSLRLDDGVVSQIPDDILIKVDDRTGTPTLVWQM